jgi:diacylglycerol kinase family enzyme
MGLLMLGVRALTGHLGQAEDFDAKTAQTIIVETRRKHVHVATDGEVNLMDTPLEYRVRPRALRVFTSPRAAQPT